MKFVFRPEVDKSRGDWYETTKATPVGDPCRFFIFELRPWFRRWVFK